MAAFTRFRPGFVVASSLLVLGACFVACADDSEAPSQPTPDASTGDGTTNPNDGSSGGDGATNADTGTPSDGGGSDADAATLTNIAVVYAGRFNNIDQRLGSATVAADGRILGYAAGTTEAPFVVTATVDALAQDPFFAASRWADGTIGGPLFDDGGVKTLLPHEGQHLGIAKVPSVDLPASGSATYTLVGATKPTQRGGTINQGTVTSGALKVEFGGNAGTRIGMNLVVTMPDGTFDLVVNGGAADVGDAGGTSGGDAGFRFTGGSITVTADAGATCAPDASACPTTGGTRIVFSGPNAERVVVAYVFGTGTIGTNRHGVAVFQKQ